MRVLPVLDIQGGVVVRGIGGRRHEYRPIVSRLTNSCWPLDVARAFRTHLELTDLYVADLDALGGAPPALPIIHELQKDGFRLWVDAGVRDLETAHPIATSGVAGLVVGLETVEGPASLAALCAWYPRQVVFSLDLKQGAPMGDLARWGDAGVRAITTRAMECGVRRLLVLDLAQVGSGGGTGTEELCRWIASQFPEVELAAGGGVRGEADLQRLKDCGVSLALVASALHEGLLHRGNLGKWT